MCCGIIDKEDIQTAMIAIEQAAAAGVDDVVRSESAMWETVRPTGHGTKRRKISHVRKRHASGESTFHEGFEPEQRLIPLLGDEVEVLLDRVYWHRIERKQALATIADILQNSCTF